MLQYLGSVAAWRQDDIANATTQEIADEITKATDHAVFAGCTMIGQIITLATALPSWCLLCDGATYDRVDYPELYGTLDPYFVVDADTFTVPDMVDRFVLYNTNIGDVGGESNHIITQAELPAHSHSVDQFGVDTSIVEGELPGLAIVPTPGITGSTGDGDAIPIMPPFIVLLPAIIARLPYATE